MRSTRSALLIAAVLVPAAMHAQAAKQAGTAKPDAKTWATPYGSSARVRDPFAAPDGKVWFVGQEGNFVANLDPQTGAFKQFKIDDGTNPHNLVVDKQGTVARSSLASPSVSRSRSRSRKPARCWASRPRWATASSTRSR